MLRRATQLLVRLLTVIPVLGLGLLGCQKESRDQQSSTPSPQREQTSGMQPAAVTDLDADMQAVIDAHTALGPKPIAQLTPQQARLQPSPADAVKSVLRAQGKSTVPVPGVTTQDVTYPGAAGEVKARIYRPAGAASSPRPVIVYYRGGGWVIANLDVYDATPRALAKKLDAIVVSADYRVAPEYPFPASHDDAIAAYRWVCDKAASWQGDPQRIALVGESAGGNLALNVAMAARDQQLQRPTHIALVYPVGSNRTDTPSYRDSAEAKPLNAAMMGWFIKHALPKAADRSDPRIDLVHANLKDLPPTTIINAQSDPLRSDGDLLAAALKTAGNDVVHTIYPGTTHEFFGMAAVVAKAEQAQNDAVMRLKPALAAR